MKRSKSLVVVVAGLASAATVAGAATSAPPTSEPVAGDPASSAPADSANASGSDLDGDLSVFAAASLTDAFTEIGDAFITENPDVEVTFSFGASSDLVNQINEGAPVDVFASADVANMDKLVDADGADDEPLVFATNSLAIIVEAGNPESITGLEDLGADPDLVVLSCAPEVPIGAYTQEVLSNAGVEVEFDSLEENVRAVVEKVVLGEADAGVVYTTDVTAAGEDAEGVEIPADVNITADYPIAVTAEAANPDGADAFEAFVVGPAGQEILASYGFGAPAEPTESTDITGSAETADSVGATESSSSSSEMSTTEPAA